MCALWEVMTAVLFCFVADFSINTVYVYIHLSVNKKETARMQVTTVIYCFYATALTMLDTSVKRWGRGPGGKT